MKWLQLMIEKVCKQYNITIVDNDKIRTNNSLISIVGDDSLYSIKVIDLVNFQPPKITRPLFYDEVEDNLTEAIRTH